MATIRTDLSDARRVYVQTAYGEPIVARLKALGAHWDAEARAWWIGAAKRSEVEALLAATPAPAADAPRAKQDPADIRLTGKGVYKGRTYYLGAQTRDGQRVRCLTLPDAKGDYLDFWANASEVQVVKTYRPREHTYRGRTSTSYTTLGGIADFIRGERAARERGEPVCAACGKHGDDLVRDLEDGMLKHPRCCDIEP